MTELDGDFFTKLGAGIAGLGAAIYGVFRLLRSDRREDTKADLTDNAMAQVIQTLRDEVFRLSERLEKVEQANRGCEEKNAAMQMEIVELKKKLHLS
jgi:hypothetical protein